MGHGKDRDARLSFEQFCEGSRKDKTIVEVSPRSVSSPTTANPTSEGSNIIRRIGLTCEHVFCHMSGILSSSIEEPLLVVLLL